jgi:glycosyltransferase involved in cell wall biosynthesis
MIGGRDEGDAMSGRPAAIAVVVPTYRRSALLPRLFAALEQQDIDDHFEVVIVDNNSPDDTTQVLQRLASHSTLTVELRVERQRGPAAARNAGWRASQAPLIAFLDDDCVPTASWLRVLVASLTDADVVVGRTVPDPRQTHAVGPFSRTMSVDRDDGLYATCNIGYRRDLLESLNGFDDSFTQAGGEDTDLGWRAIAAGAQPQFAGNAVVHHDVRPSRWLTQLLDSARWHDLPLTVAKHPQIRNGIYARVFWRRTHASALVAAAGLGCLVRGRGSGARLLAAALLAPYVYDRLIARPLPYIGYRDRALLLPAALSVDLAEVGALAVGSIQHGTLML